MGLGLLLAALLTPALASSDPADRRLASGDAPSGATGCRVARLVTEGWKNASYIGQAKFYLDGERIDFNTGRGLNILAIDPVTQQVSSRKTYDTWLNKSSEDDRLAADLQALPQGQIVLVALKDDGMENLDRVAKEALRSVGATDFGEGFRQGYALIGRKGGVAVAERRSDGSTMEVSGELPCVSCVTAKVVANSIADSKPVEFFLGGVRCNVAVGAGLNMLVLDRATQRIVDFKRFVPESRIDAAVSVGTNFAAMVHSMAEGTIALIAVWPASTNLLDDASRMALQWLGAKAPQSIANGGGYVLIGSKDGWATAEKSGISGPVAVEEKLPCVIEDTAPKEVADPKALFPGQSAQETNAAWPSGRQPKPFEAWPKSAAGRLETCWKTRVLRDTASGSLGGCRGLKPSKAKSREACRTSCAQAPDCVLWHFSYKQGCFQGADSDCNDLGHDVAVDVDEDAQQLQHGDVQVLKVLLGVQVLGLRSLGELWDPSFESVVRCRDWCYSNLNCQYWQYGEHGCFVEDPHQGAVAQYPLTLQGGATVNTERARSMLAGEYIQHFCPPEPIAFQAASKQVDYVEGAAILWNGSLLLGNRRDAAWAPEHGGAPLPAWPVGNDGTPLPCRKTQVLGQNDGDVGVWPGGCLRRANLSSLKGVSCREACLFNVSCSSWLLAGTSENSVCYHGAGVNCSHPPQVGPSSLVPWTEERIQHGEVEVLRDISVVKVHSLLSLGRCPEQDKADCIGRCRTWCYSNVRCRYWQFGSQGCLVDVVGEGAPAYASGLAGALSSTRLGDELVAGEYVQHFCRSQDILRNVTSARQYMDLLKPPPNKVATLMSGVMSRIRGFAARGVRLAEHPRRWPFNAIALAVLILILCCLCRGVRQRSHRAIQELTAKQDARAPRWCCAKDTYSYNPCPCIQEERSKRPWHSGKSKRVVVVLEDAPLEKALSSGAVAAGQAPMPIGTEELHATFECLQALLSSPLARARRLQVFLHSVSGSLVEVHPSTLPPATFREFKRLLASALLDGEVYGKAGDFQYDGPLMRTLKPPLASHLPSSRSCVALSAKGRRANLDELAEDAQASSRTMVFALGVSAGGEVREQAVGTKYAPDVVAVCPFNVKPVEVCKLVCQGLQPYMGVHDPPLDADEVQAPLRLDVRLGP